MDITDSAVLKTLIVYRVRMQIMIPIIAKVWAPIEKHVNGAIVHHVMARAETQIWGSIVDFAADHIDEQACRGRSVRTMSMSGTVSL